MTRLDWARLEYLTRFCLLRPLSCTERLVPEIEHLGTLGSRDDQVNLNHQNMDRTCGLYPRSTGS